MVPSGMRDPSASGEAAPHTETLELTRADIGFSAAHFSIIEGQPERLHGHNYTVSLRVSGGVREDGTVVDFQALKEVLRTACAGLHERTLLPARNPLLHVRRESGSVSVEVLQPARRYLFPEEDVRLLPVDNTTCECLAAHLLAAVRAHLGDAPLRLTLSVAELPGQGATVAE